MDKLIEMEHATCAAVFRLLCFLSSLLVDGNCVVVNVIATRLGHGRLAILTASGATWPVLYVHHATIEAPFSACKVMKVPLTQRHILKLVAQEDMACYASVSRLRDFLTSSHRLLIAYI